VAVPDTVSSPLPPLRPTSDLVLLGWLTLALPDVGVGDKLPPPDEATREAGFVRGYVLPGGGRIDRDVPLRSPVAAAECWFPPAEGSTKPRWHRAGQVARLVVDATFDPALMGVLVTPAVGDYAPARVHTVVALGEPSRVENDPSNYARFDVDLQITWSDA
jgi:hypothetical protein